MGQPAHKDLSDLRCSQYIGIKILRRFMALIRCTECSKDISEKAKTCPHCGAPNAVQSLGAKMHRAVETAEELARVADRKMEAINNSPKTRKAIGIYNKAGRIVSIAVAIVAVYVAVALLMPANKDHFRAYAKRYTLAQCERTELEVFDLSAKSPKLYDANAMSCMGYVDAVQKRFGKQLGNSMDIFKKVPPEHRAAFEGIDDGCSQNSWGGRANDIFALNPKAVWGGEAKTYNDGARLLAMDARARIVTKANTRHIKSNLVWCEKKFKSWKKFRTVDYYFAKLWLPPLR